MQIDDAITGSQAGAQHVIQGSHEAHLFVGVIGVMVIDRIGSAHGEVQIIVVRMAAVVVGMRVTRDCKPLRMQAEGVAPCGNEGKDERGNDSQHGRHHGPESFPVAKKHGQADRRDWPGKQESALKYPLQGDRKKNHDRAST